MRIERLLSLSALLLAASCAPSPPPTGPAREEPAPPPVDIVLVTLHAVRADLVEGPLAETGTPVLDRLREEGWSCPLARTHAVDTLPSHATILTGRLPFEHGIRAPDGFILDPEVTTLAELLGHAGYGTAAFVSSPALDRRYGLDLGFERYEDPHRVARPPGETVSAALEWWGETPQPRFLWVQLGWPQEGETRYAERLAILDAALAPLIGSLRQEPRRPLLVLTADHGTGVAPTDAALGVPLVWWWPERIEARRDHRPARHIDVVPTILELAGRPEGRLPGTSLLSQRAAGESRGHYFESLSDYYGFGAPPVVGWIEDGRKAVFAPTPALYDLDDTGDPPRDLAQEESERWEAWRRAAEARTPELLEAKAGERPDWTAAEDELTDIASMEPLLRRHPDAPVLYHRLAEAYEAAGRGVDAAELVAGAVDRGVGGEGMRRRLASLRLLLGNEDAAWEVLHVDAASRDARTQATLGRIALAQAREEEGEYRLKQALSLDPSFPDAKIELGLVRYAVGDAEGAERWLAEGLAHVADHARGWDTVGVLRLARGDADGAIYAFNRATRGRAEFDDAWLHLAEALLANDDPVAAAKAAEVYVGRVDGERQIKGRDLLQRARAAASGR